MIRRRKSKLRELLNRIWWTEKKDECYIVIIHRGAPSNRKNIPFSMISEIKAGYISIDEVQIPIHRIVEIICDGTVIWSRKKN